MKKQIITIAVLSALLALTGCGTDTVSTPAAPFGTEATTAAADATTAVSEITTANSNLSESTIQTQIQTTDNSDAEQTNESSKLGKSIFGGSVTADTAVKSKPDANSETLLTIPDGTQIGVYESGISGWFMTDFKDTIGYIPANSVKEIQPFDPLVNDDSRMGSVTADTKLMTGTHSYAEVLATIPKDAKVTYYIPGSDENWCVVSYQDKIGYVEAKYIKAIENSGTNSGSSTVQHSGDDFLGTWSVGRIYITIEKSGAGYEASVKWSSSAAESTNWTYSCEFNGEYLDSTNGRCVDSVYNENGDESTTVRYTNGNAHFRLNDSGNLIWEELRDNTIGDDTEFLKIS